MSTYSLYSAFDDFVDCTACSGHSTELIPAKLRDPQSLTFSWSASCNLLVRNELSRPLKECGQPKMIISAAVLMSSVMPRQAQRVPNWIPKSREPLADG